MHPTLELEVLLPPFLLISGWITLIAGLYRASIPYLIQRYRTRRIRHQHGLSSAAESLLVPLTPISVQQVTVGAWIGGSVGTVLGSLWLNSLWGIILLPTLIVVSGIGVVRFIERKYEQQMTVQLVRTAAEVAASMNSGLTLNAALRKAGSTLTAPLATPWNWMLETAGQSVIAADGSTRFLQVKDTARAITSQTNHRALLRYLEHVEGAADLPQSAARDRLLAVSDALNESQLREKSMRAKLAHARGSGIAVTCIGGGIALFLRFAMAEQWQKAFSGPYGMIGSAFFIGLFMLPMVGIMLLSRVPDVDF